MAGWTVLVAVDDRTGDVLGVLESNTKQQYHAPWAPDEHPGPQAWIDHIVTDPEHIQEGVGRHMLTVFCQTSVVAGSTFVALWASPLGDVQGRERFFERCGLQLFQPGTHTRCRGGSRTASPTGSTPAAASAWSSATWVAVSEGRRPL